MRGIRSWLPLIFLQLSLHATAQAGPRVIGFLTDFGLTDDSVGICKAVMEGIAPGARVIDITHQNEPYNVTAAARFLAGSAPYFAQDAVLVAVVDPGVGSARKAIALRSKTGQLFVVPDNGLITLVAERDGVAEAREITNPAWMLGAGLSSTFHGRDLFAPAAAHLARGEALALAGPAIDANKLMKLDLALATVDEKGLRGEVIGLDGPFGNLVLNVPQELFAKLGYRVGERVPVRIGERTDSLPFVKTFSDVAEGEGLLYIDSRGRLAVGSNLRSFAEKHKVGAGAAVWIATKRKP